MKAQDVKKKFLIIATIVGNNPVLPILENVLIEDGFITGTNLFSSVIQPIDVKGTFLLPFSAWKKLISGLKAADDVTFKLNKGTVELIVNGKVKAKSEAESVDDFPKIPVLKNPNWFEADQAATEQIVKGMKFVSTDELRPAMECVCIDTKSMASTDGHTLKWYDHELGIIKFNKAGRQDVMISRNVSKALARLEKKSWKISHTGANVEIFDGTTQIISRNIDEKYPDWRNVIPEKNPIMFMVNRAALIDEVKSAVQFAPKYTKQVRLKITKSQVVITAEDLDYNHEYKGNIKGTGKGSIYIAFNGELLINALKDKDAEHALIAMSEPNRAAIFDSNVLLMPVMIGNYV